MSNQQYIRPEEACRILKITTRSLVNWDKQGKIHPIRTPGGHRRYLKSEIISLSPDHKDTRQKICYCRVSTPSQKEDLERQVEFFRRQYPGYTIIKDIGSGLNFKRKGLNTILDTAIRGDIKEVVVTHRDRLCRFGFELIERIISEHSNGSIVVLNHKETSPEEELTDDLVSIITVFSSRLYGLRSHQLKQQIKDATQNNQNAVVP